MKTKKIEILDAILLTRKMKTRYCICQESIIVDVLFFAFFNPLALQTTTVSVRGWVDLVLFFSNHSLHGHIVKSPDTWESGLCMQ